MIRTIFPVLSWALNSVVPLEIPQTLSKNTYFLNIYQIERWECKPSCQNETSSWVECVFDNKNGYGFIIAIFNYASYSGMERSQKNSMITNAFVSYPYWNLWRGVNFFSIINLKLPEKSYMYKWTKNASLMVTWPFLTKKSHFGDPIEVKKITY